MSAAAERSHAERDRPDVSPSEPIAVMLVDDHVGWRDTLRRSLEHAGATVVAEAGDGDEVLPRARETAPAVVIMDLDLPTVDGVEATRRLRAERPDIKVLFLSGFDERAKVAEAVRAGASGYLVKTAGSAEIVDAVWRVSRGELVFSPAVAGAVFPEIRRVHPGPRLAQAGDPLGTLTESERQVLELMAEGRSNQAIAARLSLSPKTIEARVSGIFDKLGLQPGPEDHRRVLAVLAYLREGKQAPTANRGR